MFGVLAWRCGSLGLGLGCFYLDSGGGELRVLWMFQLGVEVDREVWVTVTARERGEIAARFS